jgi:hypothetical protein
MKVLSYEQKDDASKRFVNIINNSLWEMESSCLCREVKDKEEETKSGTIIWR